MKSHATRFKFFPIVRIAAFALLATNLCADTVVEDEAGKAFDQSFKLQGHTFRVECANRGSLNQVIITTKGLSSGPSINKVEADGGVVNAEVADLNADGFPEIYIYVQSAGSGSYASLIAYASNNKKSVSPIYLPELSDDKKLSTGYRGHDEFTIVENVLARRFKLYSKGDTNHAPSGKTRQIQYKLKAGEAVWLLYVDKSFDL